MQPCWRLTTRSRRTASPSLSPALGNMQAEYRLVFDRAYCQQMIRRYYQQRPFLVRPIGQFVLLALLCLLLLHYASAGRMSWILPVVVALCLGIGGPILVKWGVLLRMGAKANFGSAFEVTVADSGISAKGTHTSGTWEWAAYPQAVRFADGLLLLRRGVIRWLPDSGLVQGNPAAVTEMGWPPKASYGMLSNVSFQRTRCARR
jgi:hypothetical protein